MKKVAVTQSNYIPWKGYFDILRACDHVIFLDDVQYTRRDWRNRNMIKTPQGTKWLTIPVDVKNKYADLRICDVQVSEPDWAEKHWNLIHQNYQKSRFFDEISAIIRPLYKKIAKETHLSVINRVFIEEICQYLQINTQFSSSTDHFSLEELNNFDSTERLLQLCRTVEATNYISGPAAKDYMDVAAFTGQNITVQWADYSQYPTYNQPHGDFTHAVSIIDLLMTQGDKTLDYMIDFRG
jgi:hypothetical protein